MIISTLDSYYSYVAKQMATLGAQVIVNGTAVTQPMRGIVNARDWPQSPSVEGGLYLLVQHGAPSGIKSQAQMGYTFYCQWMWELIGSDIQAGQVVQSRADRYRQNIQIMQNLRNANYPGFCMKQDYSANPVTGVVSASGSVSVFPVTTVESITWTPLRFMPSTDSEKTGLVFGAAAVEVEGYDDIPLVVA